MHLDTAFFHEICIYVLYGCIGLLTFVILERLIYFSLLNIRLRRINNLRVHRGSASAPPPQFRGSDVLTGSLAEYVEAQKDPQITRPAIEDLSMSLCLRVGERINARLWLLDTIVTAAPLLGLLGTILGIMDTFNALSSGGISDPAAVSRGIAAALLATAVGIFTALYGLLGHNILHRQSGAVDSAFKIAILAFTRPDLRDQSKANA